VPRFMARLLSHTRRATALPLVALALAAAALGPAAAGASAATHAAPAAIPTGDVVDAARQELALGVRELPAGSNRAPAIRRYETATAGAAFGAPWCAYFVSYVAREAGVPIGPGGRGIGSAAGIRAWALRTGRWTRTPGPGRLIVFPQHVGVVERAGGGQVTIIEGNWSNKVGRRTLSAGAALGYVTVDTAASWTARRLPSPVAG
jgi:hypothetical protein